MQFYFAFLAPDSYGFGFNIIFISLTLLGFRVGFSFQLENESYAPRRSTPVYRFNFVLGKHRLSYTVDLVPGSRRHVD